MIQHGPRPLKRPDCYLKAARVPVSVVPRVFGPWEIRREKVHHPIALKVTGRSEYTSLSYYDENMPDNPSGIVVMEDTDYELRQHLPIMMQGHGRILITGLGLGCAVRGCLANSKIDSIDVIEIDKRIVDIVGNEFSSCDRVNLIHCDALEWKPPTNMVYNFGWHDLWFIDKTRLQVAHVGMIEKFRRCCKQQGAWKLPRIVSRKFPRVAGLR